MTNHANRSESPGRPRSARDPSQFYLRAGAIEDGIGWAFWLALIVWWIDVLQLSPLQLIAMGVVLDLTVLLCETPTGVVADLHSRKWSVVIGLAMIGLSYAWAVTDTNFWVVLPAQALYGLGWTFRSGSQLAWVSDERQSKDGLDELILRRHRWGIGVGAVLVLCVMAIGSSSIRLTIICAAIAQLAVAAAWAFRTNENHFTPASELNRFRDVLRKGIASARGRPRLKVILAVVALMSLTSNVMDRLGYLRFIESIGADSDSITVTGACLLAMAAAGIAVSNVISHRLSADDLSVTRLIIPACALMTVAALGALTIAAATGTLIIGLGLLLQDAGRDSTYPLIEAWTNRETESEIRATTHSLVGQTMAIFEVLGAVTLGLVAETAGVSSTLIISAALLGLAALAALQARTR